VLAVSGLDVEVGGRRVVADATFTVRAGDKVGLVGRNGAGKTSMLKVLGGAEPKHGGSITISGTLGYLPQDPRMDGLEGVTALDRVLSGRGFDEARVRIEKLRIAVEEEASDRNIRRYTKAEEEFRIQGGYAAESEVRGLCRGVGLEADRVDRPIGVLSGGELRRVELARILFAAPDVLLLDEPTNHLDVDAKAWVMSFLRRYGGAIIVISHDLDLLDESITRVLHLDRAAEDSVGHLVEYRGTYSQYRSARAKDAARLTKLAAQQSAEIDRLKTRSEQIKATATLATRAKNMARRAERLEAVRVEAPEVQIAQKVKLPPPPHCGRQVLDVRGVAKAYEQTVFKNVSFDLGRGERIMILGLNGAGKTTLLRILAGMTQPTAGEFEWGYQVSVGYFAQEHELLDQRATLLENLQRAVPGVPDAALRSLLGRFSLVGDKAYQDTGSLSGGEKTKLALCTLMSGAYNVLLLDEPTNNLDPPSRDAIAEALGEWTGAMVLVSHDTEFVKALAPTKVVLMPEGTIDFFSNDYLDLVSLA
jgi:ATPase subunit of ABC transporter with duplicated ATPase domains